MGMTDSGDSSARLAEFDAAYAKLRDEWARLERRLEPINQERLELDRKAEPLERRRRELDRSFAQLLTVARRTSGDHDPGGDDAEGANARGGGDRRPPRTQLPNSEETGSTPVAATAASDNGTGGQQFEASERVVAVISRVAHDLPASLETTLRAMLVLELDQGISGPLPREVAGIRGSDTTKGRAATHSYLKRLAKKPSPALVEQVSTNPARFRLADSVREVANSG